MDSQTVWGSKFCSTNPSIIAGSWAPITRLQVDSRSGLMSWPRAWQIWLTHSTISSSVESLVSQVSRSVRISTQMLQTRLSPSGWGLVGGRIADNTANTRGTQTTWQYNIACITLRNNNHRHYISFQRQFIGLDVIKKVFNLWVSIYQETKAILVLRFDFEKVFCHRRSVV